MMVRKKFCKLLCTIGAAALFVQTAFAGFPLVSYAETRTCGSGETIDTLVSGDTVEDNLGTIKTVYGTVNSNHGVINAVNGSSSRVTDNYGEIKGVQNVAKVSYNHSGATIGAITAGCTLLDNKSGATVDENGGTVEVNSGNINRNRNTVITNSGIVTDNDGTVGTNSGTITNNYGIVTSNTGTIVNQYYKLTTSTDSISFSIDISEATIVAHETGKYVKAGSNIKINLNKDTELYIPEILGLAPSNGPNADGSWSFNVPALNGYNSLGTTGAALCIHVHCVDSWTKVTDGNHIAHCSVCGEAAGRMEACDTAHPKYVPVSATSHQAICAKCGATFSAIAPSAHISSGAATESSPEACSLCGYEISPALGHQHSLHLTKHVAKAPSCTTPGNIEYYSCECGKLFTLISGTTLSESNLNEITLEGTVLSATDHSLSEWYSDRTNHWKVCKNAGCGITLVAKEAHVDTDSNHYCDICNRNLSSGGSSGGKSSGGKTPDIPPAAPDNPQGETSQTGEESAVHHPSTDVYSDIHDDDYFAGAVDWALENNIVEKSDASSFSPYKPAERSELLVFLWKALGSPNPTIKTCSFEDLEAGSSYEAAALWCVENNILNGIFETKLSPEGNLTRAQLVTFIWRANGCPVPLSKESKFTDLAAGSYYEDAVCWGVSKGIIKGMTDTEFAPNEAVTRAQALTFISRYALMSK